jgi:uncharacterized membrane protein
MDRIEKSINVDVPIRTAYDQWTQFEEFPRFMEGVQEVKQLDDKHLLWRATVGGKEKQWESEITDQVPDQRVAWHSTSGAKNAGLVTFHAEDASTTRVTLRMEYEPEGLVENVGSNMGVVSHQVENDLKRFKDFIEHRGTETGGWRGEIHGNRVEK